MGLGLNYSTGSGDGGEITPFVKYDARAGRMFRNDRTQDASGAYSSSPVDITRSFKAVFDMENIEVGWMLYAAGAAPQMQLVPLGSPLPHKPEGNFKQGVRVIMRLGKDCGNDVREISGNSGAFLRGIDELHTAYEVGEKENPGKLPVVVLKDTLPITSGSGDKKSTNYQPVFEIVSWVARPADLTPRPRSAPVSSTPAPQTASAPPSTGSTKVEPPGEPPTTRSRTQAGSWWISCRQSPT
jgi:hypothetical protein